MNKIRKNVFFLCFFVLLFFSGCSKNQENNKNIPTVTEISKSLLEQSVDWGNENLYNTNNRIILGNMSEEIGESKSEKPYDYTGYLDMNSNFAKDNPMKDYDGDGTEDRIYKEFNEDTGKDIFTLEFGNGTVLQLPYMALGTFIKTESGDLTGDGQNEILFEQYITGSGGTYLYVSIFTLDGGNYVRMKNPYEEIDTNAPDSGGMFSVPLVIEKLSDTSISLYQPDCGYQGEIITKKFIDIDGTIFDEMEHLYSLDMEDKSFNYDVSSLEYVEGNKNQTALLFKSPLGSRFVNFRFSIYWKLEYIDQKWRITNVYQPTPKRIDLGKEYHADLNRDNQEDVVYYDTKVEKQDEYELESPVLTLNGREYNGAYLEKQYGISMTKCSHLGYYLMDIDISDSYTEIAILDEGLSSGPLTYFFRYDGERLEYCGEVPDSPENRSFIVDGDGSVGTQKHLSILQTWYATSEWKFDENGSLQEQVPNFYYTYWSPEHEDKQIIAYKDLILFRNPEINQDSIRIKKGEKLYLIATDNKHWIQLSDYEGNQGWFYLHDGSEITIPGGEGKIGDILTYLNMDD